MDTVFLNLVRGNRLGMYMGLKMEDGKPYRFAPDYTYVEIPLAQIYNPTTEEVVTKVSANQKVQIIPACTVRVASNYKILVKTNPKLQALANCPAMFLMDAGSDEHCSFYAHFQKSLDREEIDWAVRLYLLT